MKRSQSVLIGLFLFVACGLCCFYGFEKYKEYNRPGETLNTLVRKVGGKDVVEREIPIETKYAGFGAALTGIAGVFFLFSGRD